MNSVQLSKEPEIYLLQNGMYEESGYIPIKADGTDQNVSDWNFDTMSIKVIDDYNVEVTTKRDGKVVFTEKKSISADGNTLNASWTHPSWGSGHGSMHNTYKRVAKGPAGANLLSGSWRLEKQEASPDYRTYTYKVNGDELTMTNFMGESFTAKLDGTEAPYKNNPKSTVSLKMLGKNTLEETIKSEGKFGKFIVIAKMKVARDGESMKYVWDDKVHGTKTRWTLIKSGSAP